MEPVALVTALSLAQYLWFAYAVAVARVRHGIQPPATSGHPELERAFRIQQNTLEQLLVFLPALWIFGWYVQPLIAAFLGLVFIAGRHVYRESYMQDPSTRRLGFGIGASATLVLLIGGLVGAIVSWSG